jgi:hypothetical protein
MVLRTPQRRVPGICDYDGCTQPTDVEVRDRTYTEGERTALRLCEIHGQPFVRAGLRALGVEVTA